MNITYQSRYYRRLAKKFYISVTPDMHILYYGVRAWHILVDLLVFFCTLYLVSSFIDPRNAFFWLPFALSAFFGSCSHAFFYFQIKSEYALVTPRDLD